MKLDNKDFRILYFLDHDARILNTALAQNVGISKQNLNYRMKRLIQEKVILEFSSVIDIHRLGYFVYRIYFRYKHVNNEREIKIIEYFKKHMHVIWFASLSGSWDLEVIFAARNFIHFNNLFKKIKDDVGRYFSKYNLSMSIVNYHFKRDYLLGKKREGFSPSYYGFEPEQADFDELDLRILLELARNCRQNSQEIGTKVKVGYHTVQQRIRKLEEEKVIQSHRILFDIKKAGRKYDKLILMLNNPTKEDEKELYSFCSQYNFVTYLVEVLGEWQLEIEGEVDNGEQMYELLREIKNKFPEIILDYDILGVVQEHKLNYLPMGEEMLKGLKEK